MVGRRVRRRALAVLLLAGSALALALGCSLVAPSFAPAIDTPEMRAAALVSRFVEGPSGPLHAVLAGRHGAPRRVLFVHGSPGTWEAWRRFLLDPELARRARLVALDRPGFGGSGRGRAEASIARQAAALAVLLADEPGPPAVVVGHSLGGPIAARLAVDRPDLVAALLLVAPSIDPALERHRWFNIAASWRAVQWLLPVDWVVSNRELWPLADELRDLAPRWAELACPVRIVQGIDDRLVPAANADFAERVLAGRDLRVTRHAGEGHFLLWEHPESVRSPLLELLDAPRAARPSAQPAAGGASPAGW